MGTTSFVDAAVTAKAMVVNGWPISTLETWGTGLFVISVFD